MASAAALAAPPAAAAQSASYLALAARLQDRLDPAWDQRRGHYVPDGGGTETAVNADMLLVEAVAARLGAPHDGRRARALAAWLTGRAVWRERPRPSWVASTNRGSQRAPVFQAEVVRALARAYLARRELGLSRRSVARIRARIRRLARSRAYRWPALRRNQINWHVEILAAQAVVERRPALLARGMRRYLGRFLDGVRARGRSAGNLGPGLRFHYLPDRPRSVAQNVDSAEYANIVLGAIRFYAAARASGMPRPARARLRLLRAWVRRALAGYWTHGGYLNWDSGLGFARWHQAKKVGLAQAALLGIATAPELQPGPAWGAWARWILDRGLARYEREAERDGGIAAAVAFGVRVVPQAAGSAQLGAARAAANAALAAEAGLERQASAVPPALYAYDPDIGRLAVTTPAYNTAIVPVSQGAFPYGGIDLARLYDGEQEVAATIGGRAPGAFGLTVRRPGGGPRLATQAGAGRLRLTRAPRGVGASRSALRAYAGPFSDLRAIGRVRAGRRSATTRYRFTPGAIEGRWTAAPGRFDAALRFPSWGAAARVVAELADGTGARARAAAAAGRGRARVPRRQRVQRIPRRAAAGPARRHGPARACAAAAVGAARGADARAHGPAGARGLRGAARRRRLGKTGGQVQGAPRSGGRRSGRTID